VDGRCPAGGHCHNSLSSEEADMTNEKAFDMPAEHIFKI
jgi:hypothetical protein